MLVLDADTQRIVGASNNQQNILGVSANAALGAPLADIARDIAKELSSLALEVSVVHEVLDTALHVGDAGFDITTHTHDGYQFIEFIPKKDPCKTDRDAGSMRYYRL